MVVVVGMVDLPDREAEVSDASDFGWQQWKWVDLPSNGLGTDAWSLFVVSPEFDLED